MSVTSAYRMKIRTGSADDQAILLLAEGALVAILVELADDGHGDDQGRWIVEASFGLDMDKRAGQFASADDAAAWVSGHIGDHPFTLGDGLALLG